MTASRHQYTSPIFERVIRHSNAVHTTFSHPPMRIETDDLSRPQVHALLEEHLTNMYELSPPEQVFALDLIKLRAPDITFWTVWDEEKLMGCGALKELSPTHGEIKSMRTPAAARGKGTGRAVLVHIISVARQRGYATLSLETGSHPAFEPAHSLYRSQGFAETGPFGSYEANPHSVFMALRLDRIS
jgi:putative acetyltransferase